MSESKTIRIPTEYEDLTVKNYRVLQVLAFITTRDVSKYALDHIFIDADGSAAAADGRCIAWYDHLFPPSNKPRRFLCWTGNIKENIEFYWSDLPDSKWLDWKKTIVSSELSPIEGALFMPYSVPAFEVGIFVAELIEYNHHPVWYPINDGKGYRFELAHQLEGLHIQVMPLNVDYTSEAELYSKHWWKPLKETDDENDSK